MLPKDPIILLSVVNTMLRDKYDSFEKMEDDLGSDASEAYETLLKNGCSYDSAYNCFKQA